MKQSTFPTPDSVWTASCLPGSTAVTSRIQKAQFRGLAPPPEVHWIGRKGGVFWDPNSADQFAHSLSLAGLDFGSGGTYLDFGCSSGRTVRTLAAAFPLADWHGCDPTVESIAWAREAMPHISFRVSPQSPPTDYADATFDGVYAISIWSHFSKDASTEWLREMARIVKPGGWLAFSTMGAASIQRRMRANPDNRNHLMRRWHQLLTSGFIFIPSRETYSARGLDTERWGLTYMTADWVAAVIAPQWALLVYDPARYGGHQDVYVLQRR